MFFNRYNFFAFDGALSPLGAQGQSPHSPARPEAATTHEDLGASIKQFHKSNVRLMAWEAH